MRADEQARQQRIREGTARINSIFDGSPAQPAGSGVNSPADMAELLRSAFTSNGSDLAQQLGQGSEAVQGAFTPEFYEGRKRAYVDYAMPQLDKQYGDAKDKLTFDLARSGTLNSSIRAGKDADLSSMYDTNRRAVLDEALSQTNNTRNQVEAARADLIAMLNSTGDVQSTVNSALSRAQALTQPAAYSPLSQMFGAFTSALGTQAAAERAQALSGGAYRAPYNTGLFSNPSAVRVS